MPKGEQEKPLRFAPLIRVSTETQKKKGESLNVQRKQLEGAIKSLGGQVAHSHWYAGQEHATPEQERRILEELIEDAKAKKFDAVMVADLSRWSRDNHRSKTDLKILRSHEIRFFVGTNEFDLNDPVQAFYVGMNTEVNEFFARQQTYKSQLSRIARAKRDIPTSGKKPYGRRWDKEKAEWELIPEAKEKIEIIAKEYLEEDIDFETLGKRHGMNGPNLHKILTKRCGDTWTIRFKSPTQSKEQPYEEVTVKGVPRLLDEQTIRKIRAKCEARRTWTHGVIKYNYLFARKIFDVATGYSLTGTTNKKGVRYYRPFRGQKKGVTYYLNANVLENAVMGELFEALGNKHKLKEAVFDGSPIRDVFENLCRKVTQKEKELKSVEIKLSNFTRAIENYNGEDLDSYLKSLKQKIKPLSENKQAIEAEIQSYKTQLETMPTEEEIEGISKMSKGILKSIKEDYFIGGTPFRDLTHEGKRKLIDLIFGGKDLNGKRYGVYIKRVDGKPTRYKYVACGRLGLIDGSVVARIGQSTALPDQKMFDPWSEIDSGLTQGIANLVRETEVKGGSGTGVKLNMPSKCHAYHCFCVHQ
jgi:DNA invertase Pin-like site-specific DNA recombinase